MSKLGWLLGAPWLALVVGCGGGDGEKLEGIWTYGTSAANGCIIEYVFESGDFKESTYCALDTGPVGIEFTSGRYSDSRGQITFSILRSSCPEAVRTDVSFDYEISRSHLTLSTPDGNLDLTRQRKPAVLDGSSVNGCFYADKTFKANPIRELP